MRAELRLATWTLILPMTAMMASCGAPAPTRPADAPLAVEFVGCEAVLRGPICTLPDEPRPLRLWFAAAPDHAVTLTIDGVPVPAEPRALAGGLQLQVTPPPGSELLALRDATAGAAWTLRLQPSLRDPALAPARARLRERDSAGTTAAALAVAPQLAPLAQVEALTLQRKAAYRESTTSEDPARRDAALAETLRLVDQTVTRAAELGLVSEQSEAALSGAFLVLHRERDLLSARTWLQRQESALAEYPYARAVTPYYAGLIDHAAGDLGGALRRFGESELRSRRLGLPSEEQAAATMVTSLLGQLGRVDEVLARTREQPTGLQPCDRAAWLNNVGWSLLSLGEAGHPTEDPTPPLESALALSEPGGECPNASTAENVRLNLAFAALARDDPEDARPLLDLLRAAEPRARAARWLRELEGRAALQEGRTMPDAELMAREPDDAELGLSWSAAVRRGQALQRLGLPGAALDAYREAEALLDRMAWTIDFDQGRELLLAGKQRSARLLVDLLLDHGRPDAALCAARLARLRSLRELDQRARLETLAPEARARWDRALAAYHQQREQVARLQREAWRHVGAGELHHRNLQQAASEAATRALDEAYAELGRRAATSCDDLPAPAPDELLLLLFAGEADTIAFARDTAGVAAVRLPSLDPRDLAATSRALLQPFAARLAAAGRLRVLASGGALDVPVHALPWADDVVLSTWPVSYALDLPGPRAPAAMRATALVIADPSGDLAHARDEARAVASALVTQGWQVTRLEQREATGAAVSAALADVGLLHYAGHGRRDGLSGWGSVLALADDGTLAVHDVLALPRAPQLVVLSGCETAASDPTALAGGMNLARAFLLAGSSAVIAAGEVIDDALAAEVSAKLHDALTPGTTVDAPARLRDALLALRRAHPRSQEWAKYRALVP